MSEPKTSEQPSGHLRWREYEDSDNSPSGAIVRRRHVLQQLWYLTEYRDLEVSQTEEWRDVPVVVE